MLYVIYCNNNINNNVLSYEKSARLTNFRDLSCPAKLSQEKAMLCYLGFGFVKFLYLQAILSFVNRNNDDFWPVIYVCTFCF